MQSRRQPLIDLSHELNDWWLSHKKMADFDLQLSSTDGGVLEVTAPMSSGPVICMTK